jgi:hypothetical protein
MTADADTPVIDPVEFHDALWMWATHEALSREGRGKDLEKAAYYIQRFAAMVDDFKDAFCRPTPQGFPEVPFFV